MQVIKPSIEYSADRMLHHLEKGQEFILTVSSHQEHDAAARAMQEPHMKILDQIRDDVTSIGRSVYDMKLAAQALTRFVRSTYHQTRFMRSAGVPRGDTLPLAKQVVKRASSESQNSK